MMHVVIITAVIICIKIMTGGGLEPKTGPKCHLHEQKQSYRTSLLWPQRGRPLLKGRVRPEDRVWQGLSWRGLLGRLSLPAPPPYEKLTCEVTLFNNTLPQPHKEPCPAQTCSQDEHLTAVGRRSHFYSFVFLEIVTTRWEQRVFPPV